MDTHYREEDHQALQQQATPGEADQSPNDDVTPELTDEVLQREVRDTDQATQRLLDELFQAPDESEWRYQEQQSRNSK